MNARKPGFTLVELLVVVVLGAFVLVAAYQTMLIQQDGYRDQRAKIATQQTTRTALATLAAELREISTRGGDLVVAEPESVAFRAFRKIGFVCEVDLLGTTVDIWELGAEFEVGDSAVLFVEGDTLTSDDDAWEALEVSAVSSGGCSEDWDDSSPDTRTLAFVNASAIMPDVQNGAVVRSFERLTYGIYQIDDEWVLGRHGTGENPVTLLRPLQSPADGGLEFVYYDTLGAEITPANAADRESVARIGVTIRGVSPREFALSAGERVLTLNTELFLRNY